MAILQYLILGIVQGITEWLPLSSSGMNALIMSNFFGITNLGTILQTALFLHLGTFLAALIYFRKDVWKLIQTAFNYQDSSKEFQKTLNFIILSTVITGIVGIIIMEFFIGANLELTGRVIGMSVGALLLLTGILQITTKSKGLRKEENIKHRDATLAGFAQGLAVLPGLSRSGITTSTLLLKNFDDTSALRLSFLMSLPVILLGNILINLPDIKTTFTHAALVGLLAAFVFGLLTIHGLMKLSKKINFGWFAIIFALLMIGSFLI